MDHETATAMVVDSKLLLVENADDRTASSSVETIPSTSVTFAVGLTVAVATSVLLVGIAVLLVVTDNEVGADVCRGGLVVVVGAGTIGVLANGSSRPHKRRPPSVP